MDEDVQDKGNKRSLKSTDVSGDTSDEQLLLILRYNEGPLWEYHPLFGVSLERDIFDVEIGSGVRLSYNLSGVGVQFGGGQRSFFALQLLSGKGKINGNFYISDGKTISKMKRTRSNIIRFLYSPTRIPGFIYNLGFEQVALWLKTNHGEKHYIIIKSPLVDFGYQLGGMESPTFFKMKLRVVFSPHKKVRYRTCLNLSLGYQF